MKITFLYDDQDDYLVTDKIEYADFCLKEEAECIVGSLERLGHCVNVIKGRDALIRDISKLENIDLVFNKTEGFKSRNREGMIPALLELLRIPFTGTDAYGFSLSLNKYHTKLIAIDKGILTPQFVVIEKEEDCANISQLKFPIIIKPNNEGSSMGCEIFYELNDELWIAIKHLLIKFEQPVIVEEYINGIDISVPIIGTGSKAECIGVVEFSNADGSYPKIASTEFKYVNDYKTSILERDEQVLSTIKNAALRIYRALECRDFGRIDFRLQNNIPYFLEINPLPTLCKNGAFDICANHLGLNMDDVICRIIESALDKNK